MNNELKIFENKEFGQVRTVEVEGKPYFVASDIAKSLGYSNPRDAISRHCKGVVKHDTPTKSGIQSMSYISEGDIYRLITHSKLPSAERFERWVFDEVLPSIRKNGGYINGQESMSDDELMAKALLVAQNKITEKDKKIAEQGKQIDDMKQPALLGKAITTADTSILVGDLAKILKQNGIPMGAQRLFHWLRDNGYLIKRKGTDWNLPTQKSMEMGLFEIKESVHIDGNGCNKISRTPKVTGKGQQYFINKFLNDDKKTA